MWNIVIEDLPQIMRYMTCIYVYGGVWIKSCRERSYRDRVIDDIILTNEKTQFWEFIQSETFVML